MRARANAQTAADSPSRWRTLVTGHFTAYTYVLPVPDRVPGLGAGTVMPPPIPAAGSPASATLLARGVSATAIPPGAFTGGRAADGLGPVAVPAVGGGPALPTLPAVPAAGTRRPDPAGDPAPRERG
ncbi:hypothetical protein ACH4LS_02275 [Streptomyces luteogriseus]|uniref:hypothetical protein n=1 Tax=Streptomyces luteogriseus TaxID=68233 RepID=UPI0037A32DAE